MIDPDHDNTNTPTPTSQERLDVTVFHLTQLYQRLSHDRDHWIRTGRQLAGAMDTFDQQLQQWAHLDKAIQQQLRTTIDEGSHQITSALTTTFKEATHVVLTQEIKGTADHLVRLSQETERMLQRYQNHIQSMRNWQMVINLSCALLGGLMSGALIVYILS